MNSEFQIHGVLSSGQKTWKQDDKDYYAQFYSDQSEDILMIIEVVNRPHGVSAYYNYLRNNNIISSREGSYFGMTMRIDGAFCRDVKSIYMILDNIFNKMIVGSLLVQKGDKYEYSIDSFNSKNDYLQQVEKQFTNMLNAFCASQDFFDVSSAYTSLGKMLSINASEITIPIAVETIKQRAKIYLSPTFQSKAAQKVIADTKAKANAAIADAEARIKAAENAHSQSKQKQERDFESWKKEKKSLEGERDNAIRSYKELEQKVKKANLNISINERISEIKEPLKQLAGLMAERFQEDTYGNIQEKPQLNKKRRKEDKLFVWLPWAICLLLGVILAAMLFFMGGSKKNSMSDDIIKEKNETIQQLKDSISKMVNPGGEIQTDVTNNIGKDLIIDIKELTKGEELTKKQTYTCQIKGNGVPTEKCHWVITGGATLNNNTNQFTVLDTGTIVTISYCQGNEEIKHRTINVKQQ